MSTKRAFTLIELLVVIAIIAILAAILFPVFQSAKQAAKNTQELSNAKQLGTATKIYLADYDDTMPIYYAYNSIPSAWLPGHKGVETELLPYTKSKQISQSPMDSGGPGLSMDPGFTAPPQSYWAAYGSSFKFTTCLYSIVAGESSENNGDPYGRLGVTNLVTDTSMADPSNSRVQRLEMLPWFAAKNDPGCAKYGYDCPAPGNYYKQWGPVGGSIIFADSHARFVVSGGAFDKEIVDQNGDRSGDPNPSSWSGTWYGLCD